MFDRFDDRNGKLRGQIIARSPLLRAFTDDALYLSDPALWFTNLRILFLRKAEDMLKILDNGKMDQDLNVYFKLANDSVFFSHPLKQETRGEVVAMLLFMGFEIGNQIDVDLFRNDILDRLNSESLLSDTVDNIILIEEIMKCGASWGENVGDDLSRDLRDALSRIDFNKLDEDY